MNIHEVVEYIDASVAQSELTDMKKMTHRTIVVTRLFSTVVLNLVLIEPHGFVESG